MKTILFYLKNGEYTMKTTREHFNLTTDELIQVKHDSDYTKEECLVFDAGEKMIFLKNLDWL